MDGEDGLTAKETHHGTITADEETSYITITDLPIDESSSDVPSMLSEFRQPVTVKAVEMTLISAPTAERPAPAQGSTTTGQPPSAPESVEVTIKLLTRKPGDEDFTEVTVGYTEQPKVSQSKTRSFTRSWRPSENLTSVLFDASTAD